MYDPQDLLYTNNFITPNAITKNELSKETEYYDRFKNYVDNSEKSQASKYISDDLYESSSVNINKTLDTKWPTQDNKNHYPLFDTFVNDISVNTYKKEVVTKINIDSTNRDISRYFNSNQFALPLSKVFNNVKKIVLNDFIFPNVNQSLTNVNNNLSWQYASSEFLVSNNIDNFIIPVPLVSVLGREISYSLLPNSVYKYILTENIEININNYLVYQASIKPGFYTIPNLIKNIQYSTSLVLHGSNISSEGVVEAPYTAYPKRIGTPHLFSCSVDPITSVVRFVNRIEEVGISAMQTFSPYDINFKEDDIFYYFSSNSSNPSYTLDSNYIYITVPAISDITYQYYKNINCIYSPNAFPLVITGLTGMIGNIDTGLINYTEFYDVEIYLKNGYIESELDSISHYKFIDTITFNSFIGSIPTSKVYLRFGLKLSTGNLNGNNYQPNGKIVIPCITNNIVYSDVLNNIFKCINNTSGIPSILTDYSYEKGGVSGVGGPLIGRALLFRWIFDVKNGDFITYEYNTENEKKRSLLNIMGWPIANQTNQIYTVDSTNGFRFVHTNYQALILNKSTLSVIEYNKINTAPAVSLCLQYFANEYYFISSSYIYLKITFPSSEGVEIDSQYLNAVSANNLIYNQVYVSNLFFDVGIGQDYTCIKGNLPLDIYKKDQSYIFTKIILSNIPGNYDTTLSNIINNNSYHFYYNSTANKLDVINIEVFDSTMKLLSINNNFSFTMEIHEIKEVLKETFINTKTNNVNTTGNFI